MISGEKGEHLGVGKWNCNCNGGEMTTRLDNVMGSCSFFIIAGLLLRLVVVLFCSQIKVFSRNYPILLDISFKIAFYQEASLEIACLGYKTRV